MLDVDVCSGDAGGLDLFAENSRDVLASRDVDEPLLEGGGGVIMPFGLLHVLFKNSILRSMCMIALSGWYLIYLWNFVLFGLPNMKKLSFWKLRLSTGLLLNNLVAITLTRPTRWNWGTAMTPTTPRCIWCQSKSCWDVTLNTSLALDWIDHGISNYAQLSLAICRLPQMLAYLHGSTPVRSLMLWLLSFRINAMHTCGTSNRNSRDK